MKKIRLFLAGLATVGVAMSVLSTSASAQIRRQTLVLDDGTGIFTTLSGTATGMSMSGGLTLGSPLAVGSGGLGITNPTAGALLLGNGTSAVTTLVGTGLNNGIPIWDDATHQWKLSSSAIGDLAYQNSSNVTLTNLHFDNSQDHTVDILQSAAGVAGHSLTVASAAAGTGNANGGDLTLASGAHSGTGTDGNVYIKVGGSTTAVSIDNTGVTTINNLVAPSFAPTNITFPTDATPTTRNINVVAQTTAATAGNAIAITGGTGNTTGTGGALSLTGGTGGGTGNGGDVNITGGTGNGGGHNGDVNITGRNINFTGNVSLPAGSVSAGSVSLTQNDLMVGDGSSHGSALATANSSVLVTDGSGVPSLSKNLPSGLAVNNATNYGATFQITDGAKSGSGLPFLLSTNDGAGAAMQLSISRVTNTSFDINAIEQGAVYKTININTAGAGPVNIGNGGTIKLGSAVGVGTASPASSFANTSSNYLFQDNFGDGINPSAITWATSGNGFSTSITNTGSVGDASHHYNALAVGVVDETAYSVALNVSTGASGAAHQRFQILGNGNIAIGGGTTGTVTFNRPVDFNSQTISNFTLPSNTLSPNSLTTGGANTFLTSNGTTNSFTSLNVGSTLTGNGVGSALGIDVAHANAWTASQTFATTNLASAGSMWAPVAPVVSTWTAGAAAGPVLNGAGLYGHGTGTNDDVTIGVFGEADASDGANFGGLFYAHGAAGTSIPLAMLNSTHTVLTRLQTGTSNALVTFPSTDGTLALAGANTDITSIGGLTGNVASASVTEAAGNSLSLLAGDANTSTATNHNGGDLTLASGNATAAGTDGSIHIKIGGSGGSDAISIDGSGNTTISNLTATTLSAGTFTPTNITLPNDNVPTGRTISVADQTNSNVAGNNLSIAAGKGNGTGAGGNLNLSGGAAGSVLGDVNINGTNVYLGATNKFANNTGNTVGSDNTGAITAGGTINWLGSGTGYVQTLFNSGTAAQNNGLEVKVAGTNSGTYAFDVSQQAAQGTQGTSLFNVRANGTVNVPGTLSVGTLNLTSQFTGDFTLSADAAHSIGIQSSTTGAGQTLTIQGENTTAGTGGNVVLQPGTGSTGDGIVKIAGKLAGTHVDKAAAATIDLSANDELVVRITAVVGTQANAITPPSSPADGQLIIIVNQDNDATTGLAVAANSTGMFMYFTSIATWVRILP